MAEHIIAGALIYPTFSLKQYIVAQRRFRGKCNETIAAVEEDARFYDSPLKLISGAKAYTDIFFDEIIRELIQSFDLYNCTKEDFVGDGNFPQFEAILQDFEKYAAYVKATGDVSVNIQLEQASQEAASQITGMGFGLISNSLLSHLIYAAQSEATIKKQTEKAQSYYNQQEQQIQAVENRKIEQKCRRYYDKITVPRLKVEIHKIYANALVAYIKILNGVGYIDLEDIQGFNFERSQQILRNLNATSNPQNVVAAALSECPYNTDIYVQAIQKGILKKELTELAKDLGIEAELNNILGTSSDPKIDAYIDSQLERFLCNEIDIFEDSWRSRANTYLRESKLIAQRYPESFAGYGLAASYLIASNWDNRTGSFWLEVNDNIDKFFSKYTGDEEYGYHFDAVLSQISSYLCTYFERAEEYIKDNWHNDSEYQMWQIVSSAKKAQIPAINTYLKFISCIEKKFTGEKAWRVKMEKNTLLWHVYVFCLPHLIHRSVDGTIHNLVDIFYHLPLNERDFAIKLYDKLIEEGVDNFDSGIYSLKKKDTSYHGLKEKVQIYGAGVWRQEISSEGMKYLSSSCRPSQNTGGCYIATAIYGSYDCPQVWTLRRYRDHTLAKTWYGRTFIRIYYSTSPILIKLFGHTDWFKKMWKEKLDHMVAELNTRGVEDTPYEDRMW